MKIENNGINPLAPKATDGLDRAESAHRKPAASETARVSGRDKAELSESARLLARARASLDQVGEVESEKVQMLRKQVESGDYTVQVEEIARRLMRLLR